MKTEVIGENPDPVPLYSRINATYAGLGSSVGLRGEKPGTGSLSSGTLTHCDTYLNSEYFVGDATLWDTLR